MTYKTNFKMSKRVVRRLFLLSIAMLTAQLYAQQTDISIADKFSSDSLYALIRNPSVSINWIDDKDNSFYYRLEESNDFRYYLFNCKKEKKTKLFTMQEILKKMDKMGFSDEVADSTAKSRIYKLDFNPSNLSYCDFKFKDNLFRYNIQSKELTRRLDTEEKKSKPLYSLPSKSNQWAKHSSDSLFYLTTLNHNLFLFNTVTGDSLQLTNDGEHYYSYALGGNSDRTSTKPQGTPIGEWIGDSHVFFLIREDKRRVGTMSIVDNLNEPRPKLRTYKFEIPGDKEVIQYDAFIVNADSSKIYNIDISKYPDQKIETPRFSGYIQSKNDVYFIRRPRTNDKVELCRVNIHTHRVSTVISDDCSPRLNEQLFNYKLLNKGKEILWWSERSGRGSYYLYSENGELLNQVTPEKFIASTIVNVDDSVSRSIIVEGYGGEKNINPHYKQFYKASLDKPNNTVLLTPGNGDHSINLSPDKSYFVDTYSRMNLAPINEVRDENGRLISEIARADFSALYERGWKEPEVVEFIAADSITKLYGVVYLPFDIKPNKKYPIISNVYPGPHTDLMPQKFSLDDNYNQSLAQLGFVVINVAYRGSGPYRGRDFYIFGHNNLRDYPLSDDKAVIKQVANKYPFADIDCVGIYGHSGGGFMAATAMLTDPDFYKVGVAASGNYDNNIYTRWWGETFHGVEEKRDSIGNISFESNIPTTIELAENLKGNLLLITGDVDINVHPANTFRLAKALMKSNKRFDMMVFPGIDHGLGDKYYINLIRYYFVENLLKEKQNNIDIINHK